jgi:S1-C subfamily serine protease
VIVATPWSRRRRGRPAALAAGIVLAAALLAGCGGSSGDTGSETSAQNPPRTNAQKPQVIIETAGSSFNPAEIYRRASPGTVTIKTVFDTSGGLLGGPPGAEGSGIVLSKEGEIVTNAHVVTEGSGSSLGPAKKVYVVFSDRNILPAKIVGFDPFSDVALLKVNPDGLDLHPLKLGDDSSIVTGQPVAAIGNPFFEEQSLSVGVVSATDRSVQSLTQFQIEGAIQTDASINPGNSGGPLLDADARVIGLNEQIESRSGSNSGVGFAVPISAVKRSVAQLRANGKVEYAYMGVSSEPVYPQLARKLGLDVNSGALIATVVPGGPADKAGLKAGHDKLVFQAQPYTVGGDVVITLDGHKVVGPPDLARLISVHEPGDKVTLGIIRDGKHKQVEVTLGLRPTSLTGG